MNSEQEAPAGFRKPSSVAHLHLQGQPRPSPASAAATHTAVWALGPGPSATAASRCHLGLCRPNSRLLSAGLTSKAQVKKAGAGVLWGLWAKGLSQEFNPLPSVPRELQNANSSGKTGERFPQQEPGAREELSEPARSSWPSAWLSRWQAVRALRAGDSTGWLLRGAAPGWC